MNLLLLISLITSMVAGRPVPVTCQYVSNHAGYYNPQKDVIILDPLICAKFTAPPKSRDKAVAIYSLLHEAEHARGFTDEHQTDCMTLHDFPSVVRRAGLTPALNRWAQPIHDAMPPPYSGPCL